MRPIRLSLFAVCTGKYMDMCGMCVYWAVTLAHKKGQAGYSQYKFNLIMIIYEKRQISLNGSVKMGQFGEKRF